MKDTNNRKTYVESIAIWANESEKFFFIVRAPNIEHRKLRNSNKIFSLALCYKTSFVAYHKYIHTHRHNMRTSERVRGACVPRQCGKKSDKFQLIWEINCGCMHTHFARITHIHTTAVCFGRVVEHIIFIIMGQQWIYHIPSLPNYFN